MRQLDYVDRLLTYVFFEVFLLIVLNQYTFLLLIFFDVNLNFPRCYLFAINVTFIGSIWAYTWRKRSMSWKQLKCFIKLIIDILRFCFLNYKIIHDTINAQIKFLYCLFTIFRPAKIRLLFFFDFGWHKKAISICYHDFVFILILLPRFCCLQPLC